MGTLAFSLAAAYPSAGTQTALRTPCFVFRREAMREDGLKVETLRMLVEFTP